EKRWLPGVLFIGGLLLTPLLIILPLTRYEFGYWFNYGQPPHSLRMSVKDIVNEFLPQSQWLILYPVLIIILFYASVRRFREFIQNKHLVLFTLLTLGILAEAAIFQVTSYLPVDNNIFFHAFAVAYILTILIGLLPISANTWKTTSVLTVCILLWWSH